LGGSQETIGPENKSSVNDKVKSDAGKNPEEATSEQSKVPGAKTETRIEAGPPHGNLKIGQSSFPNRTI
jgi:hypothetical protein